MEEKKKLYKNWKVWVELIVIVLVITFLVILSCRNKLTSQETVSRFMYLIENKDYKEAKKLSSGNLEKLDKLAYLKLSSLTFKFSEDKKNATAMIFEDEETGEITTMYVNLENSFWGWKIKDVYVRTELVSHDILQKRLEEGKTLSTFEFCLWAISDETDLEDISKYANDNLMILSLFAHFMEEKEYDRAMKLYKKPDSEVYAGRELTEEEIKNFNWGDYEVYNYVELYGMNTYMLDDGLKKINVMISYDHTILHIYIDI